MPDRAEILRTIDDAYAARARGDKQALALAWAPGAHYRLAGDTSLVSGFPTGPGEAVVTTADIIDLVEFRQFERIAAVVEDNKAAVLWRVTASVAGQPPVTTELFDLIEVDESGKLASMVQFCDTAALARLLG